MPSSPTLKFYFHLHSVVFCHTGEKGMEPQPSWWAFGITCSLLALTLNRSGKYTLLEPVAACALLSSMHIFEDSLLESGFPHASVLCKRMSCHVHLEE